MARGIQNYQNIVAPNSDYPNGRSKNNTGINDGTPMKEETIGDYQQFFAKLMRVSGLAPNQLPDNEYNGLQYYEALLSAAVPYWYYAAIISQASTAAPVATVMPKNSIGNIVWTRTGVGAYQGTLTGKLTAFKTIVSIRTLEDIGISKGFVRMSKDNSSNHSVRIATYDATLTPSDDILVETPLEIKVFR